MLKNISQLECKVGEKVFHLLCDMDSPLPHVKEAVLQFLKYIQHVEDQVKAQEEAKKTAEASPAIVDEVKPAE